MISKIKIMLSMILLIPSALFPIGEIKEPTAFQLAGSVVPGIACAISTVFFARLADKSINRLGKEIDREDSSVKRKIITIPLLTLFTLSALTGATLYTATTGYYIDEIFNKTCNLFIPKITTADILKLFFQDLKFKN